MSLYLKTIALYPVSLGNADWQPLAELRYHLQPDFCLQASMSEVTNGWLAWGSLCYHRQPGFCWRVATSDCQVRYGLLHRGRGGVFLLCSDMSRMQAEGTAVLCDMQLCGSVGVSSGLQGGSDLQGYLCTPSLAAHLFLWPSISSFHFSSFHFPSNIAFSFQPYFSLDTTHFLQHCQYKKHNIIANMQGPCLLCGVKMVPRAAIEADTPADHWLSEMRLGAYPT